MTASKECFRPVPGGGQRVTPGATSSAAISLGITDDSIDVARFYNTKTVNVFIRLGGASAGAATTTTDFAIPAGEAYDIGIQGFTHYTHIAESAVGGDLIINPGTYVKV
jgi:hypothetical protein